MRYVVFPLSDALAARLERSGGAAGLGLFDEIVWRLEHSFGTAIVMRFHPGGAAGGPVPDQDLLRPDVVSAPWLRRHD